MYKYAVLAAVGLSCILASLSCAAQGTVSVEKPVVQETSSATYRAGMKTITVPPPADLRETGPDYRVLFEKNAPDTNRLVAAFLPEQDVARLPGGPEGGFIHYALFEILRQAEFADVDEAVFKQAEEAVAKQFGTSADAPALDLKGFQDEVNHKLKAVGGTGEISLDNPVSLGVFFSKPNVFGVGMMTNVGSAGKLQKMLVGSTFLRVQNRLMYAFVYAKYTGDDSVAWVRTTSEQWADAILKANAQ